MVQAAHIRLGELAIDGWSRAGEETWFRVHPPGLAFDLGRGALALAGVGQVFLSHGHLDHAAGLPFQLSQRSRHATASTRVYCPAEVCGDLEAFVRAAERLERVPYRVELVGLAPGERVEVGKGFAVSPFATDHVVPSLGFHLLRRKRRLAEEYAGWPREELLALRERGIDPSAEVEEHWLTYCGDTGPALLEREPRIFEGRVLLLECTFLGEAMRERGNLYKHLHLNDLIPYEERFDNRLVVLHHLSRRHRPEEMRAALEREMPRLAGRVTLLVDGELA